MKEKKSSSEFIYSSPEIRDLRQVNTNISESIGVMAFAFMCQHNSFLIFNSMNEKSLSRWRIVTLITTSTAFLFAVTYAITGYFVFGQQTEGINKRKKNLIFSMISVFFHPINLR